MIQKINSLIPIKYYKEGSPRFVGGSLPYFSLLLTNRCSKKKIGTLHTEEYLFSTQESSILLADSEHLGAASRADALGCWLAVLHRDGFGVLHFLLGAALNTISLHSVLPPLWYLCE